MCLHSTYFLVPLGNKCAISPFIEYDVLNINIGVIIMEKKIGILFKHSL